VEVKRLVLVSLLALATPEAAHAQEGPRASVGTGATGAAGAGEAAATVSQVESDGSLNTSVDRAGNIYTIDGGTLAGTNLFHSFAAFDLAGGDVAQWVHSAGDPAAISNVVNRVTGGDASHIFGTIDSTAIPNADFYFINPAGIVFGATAQVNVPAAAHFSTASELRFASGPAFQTAAPDGSTLSVAAPAAFGFIGGEGAILVQDAGSDFLRPMCASTVPISAPAPSSWRGSATARRKWVSTEARAIRFPAWSTSSRPRCRSRPRRTPRERRRSSPARR
jgi:filamentous hemagglutinin family protein